MRASCFQLVQLRGSITTIVQKLKFFFKLKPTSNVLIFKSLSYEKRCHKRFSMNTEIKKKSAKNLPIEMLQIDKWDNKTKTSICKRLSQIVFGFIILKWSNEFNFWQALDCKRSRNCVATLWQIVNHKKFMDEYVGCFSKILRFLFIFSFFFIEKPIKVRRLSYKPSLISKTVRFLFNLFPFDSETA